MKKLTAILKGCKLVDNLFGLREKALKPIPILCDTPALPASAGIWRSRGASGNPVGHGMARPC